VDIILGVRGNAILSGRWRDFALGHHLHIGDHLVFRFRLRVLEASVRVFIASGVHHTYPSLRRWSEEVAPSRRSSGEDNYSPSFF
jgi:hypothetical protein